MQTIMRHKHITICAVATIVLAVVVVEPSLLGGRVHSALDGLGAADPTWLWLGAAALCVMQVAGGFAWRTALGAAGAPVSPRDAVARYCVGSGVNAAAPAHLGSAVRIGLFARVVPGEGVLWRIGGAGAAVGAVRSVWLSCLVVAAAVSGGMPVWPLAPLGVGVLVATLVCLLSSRIRCDHRVAHAVDAFVGLRRSPRALVRVAALTALGLTAKVAAAAAVCAALGVGRPLAAALVVVPAVELAAVMPLTPGNIGIASAAVAVALGAHGAGSDTAIATGIAFGATETLTAAAAGLAGALALSGRSLPYPLRWAAASASVCAVASTCALTIAV